MVVTFVCGILAKKYSWFDKRLIPIQNLAIGFIMAIVNYIVTKDFSSAIALSGLLTGGAYDIGNNLNKIRNGN